MPGRIGSAASTQQADSDELRAAFLEFAASRDGSRRRDELREWLVLQHAHVAVHIAARFAWRGQPQDDLRQVALLGMVNAVNRFDPDRGVDFLAFAVPTVMGEVRRYFRDHTWAVRVPRRLQLLRMSISRAADDLAHEHGRAAAPAQLAERLDVSVEEIYEGLAAANAYRASSLDKETGVEGDGMPLAELIGQEDADLARVENRQALIPLLARLPARERRIIVLRFFANLTQSQISDKIGISQMHVSRLLSKTLEQLRQMLLE